MNIDFLLEAEPLDKMVAAYVELEQRDTHSNKQERIKKQVVLLNSILVHLVTNKKGLTILFEDVKYVLEVNDGDRDCLRRGAQLMSEAIRRSQLIVSQTPLNQLAQIIKLSCQKAFITVCGNNFISLISLLCSQVDLTVQSYRPIRELLLDFVVSPKLQIISYRQETRLCLYNILLKLLSLYTEQAGQWKIKIDNQNKLIQRCVMVGDGEKDPRNIGLVFEIYLKIFEIFTTSQLQKYKTSMFQNLQAYYPIQFIGDEGNEEHQKVNVREITAMLDQCLCHSFFIEQTWDLISAKTAAPPISRFVPTILLYLQTRRMDGTRQQLSSRLKNLLNRLSEDSYIEEEYDEDVQDLSIVLVKLLDVLFCRADGTITLLGYTQYMEWLDMMLGKILKGECSHSGAKMGIFRVLVSFMKSIVKRSKDVRFASIIQIFRCHSIRSLLKLLTPQNQLVPKLGLAVVTILDLNFVSQNLSELLGLLVLKVGNLYDAVTDQIKMLLLKTLLQVYKSCPQNRTMIRRVNDCHILKDCLARAKESFKLSLTQTQAYLIKAFIDFVGVVYIVQTETIIENVQGNNFQLQVYLLCRLWQSLLQKNNVVIQKREEKHLSIIAKFNYLIQNLSNQKEKEGMVKSFKILNAKDFYQLISKLNWKARKQSYYMLFDLLVKLREYFKIQIQSFQNQQYPFLDQTDDLLKMNIYYFFDRRDQFTSSDLSKEQILWRSFNDNQQKIAFPVLSKIGTQFDYPSFLFLQQFSAAYPPTFIHWQWQQSEQITDQQLKNAKIGQLLKLLPQKLLLRDSQKIIQLLLNNNSLAPSLLKIVRHMDVKTIMETGIVKYCIQSIKEIDLSQSQSNKNTQSNVCIISILISLCQKEEGQTLKGQLRKQVKTLKKLLLNRKRPIRQATRKLLSLVQ